VLLSWALVAHVCNPCYSGGRDQEDSGSKPAQANSYLKNPFTKIGLVECLKVKALSSSPSTEKQTKKPMCYWHKTHRPMEETRRSSNKPVEL
jgi:hypothetical protein